MTQSNTCFQKQNDPLGKGCSGMYSRKAWGGSVDPFILAKFIQNSQPNDGNPLVSLVIFEWDDKDLLGKPVSDDTEVCRLA